MKKFLLIIIYITLFLLLISCAANKEGSMDMPSVKITKQKSNKIDVAGDKQKNDDSDNNADNPQKADNGASNGNSGNGSTSGSDVSSSKVRDAG